jgi:hypothetical protein
MQVRRKGICNIEWRPLFTPIHTMYYCLLAEEKISVTEVVLCMDSFTVNAFNYQAMYELTRTLVPRSQYYNQIPCTVIWLKTTKDKKIVWSFLYND